ncbi:hypothetical protein IKD98_01855 [Candidatus Saccharibacteria bacterium]|nr:hypothetical protein [Candidatus Saccharibacteria bacterium]
MGKNDDRHRRVTDFQGDPQTSGFGGKKIRQAPSKVSGKTHPELAKRHAPRFSRRSYQIVVGRTIGERREKLETKNERIAARKKDKKKKATRIIITIIGFAVLIVVLIVLYHIFLKPETSPIIAPEPTDEPVTTATIPITDEGSNTSDMISTRMKTYVAEIEQDLKRYGYHPAKAVVPSSSIREVDIYLEEYPGYIKTVIDRGAGVTAEDADRLLRYLAGQGITEFEYIDVRIDGKAFWK